MTFTVFIVSLVQTGMKQILKVNPNLYQDALRAAYCELVAEARRSSCFCVVLIAAVCVALGVNICRPNRKAALRVTKIDLRYLLKHLARRGMSPKVSSRGIPEGYAYLFGARYCFACLRKAKIFSKAKALRIKSKFRLASLQKQCRRIGINPRPSGGGFQQDLPQHLVIRMLLGKGHSFE